MLLFFFPKNLPVKLTVLNSLMLPSIQTLQACTLLSSGFPVILSTRFSENGVPDTLIPISGLIATSMTLMSETLGDTFSESETLSSDLRVGISSILGLLDKFLKPLSLSNLKPILKDNFARSREILPEAAKTSLNPTPQVIPHGVTNVIEPR